MILHAAPDESLLARLPLPLAQLYRRAYNAKTALERHLTAFYLWEAALKLLASTAIVEYAERGPAAPDIAERLKNLARPALGHWWELVRLLVPTLAEAGDENFSRLRDQLLGKPTTDCPRAAGLDALLREVLENKPGARTTVQFTELFHRLVSLRNDEVGHGAAGQRSSAYYERSGPALLAGVAETLARLDVLAGRCLVHVADVRRLASGEWLVERLNLSGGEVRRLESLTIPEADASRLPRPGRLYLHEPAAASWHSLHPLVLFDADAEQVFFLNSRVRQKRAEYLCYTSGQVVKRDELGQEQRELLAKVLGGPVDGAAVEEWAECSTAGDPPQVGLASRVGPEASTRTLGEFELLSRLGRGGMGVVYRAWQPSLCRQVALKCLLRSGDPKSEARFAREILALGRVEHPNLVKVFTSGSDGDQWFYAMELIEGTDLAAVCAQFASSTASEVSEDDWTAAVSTARDQQRQQETPLSAELGTGSAERTAVIAPRSAFRVPRSGKAHISRAVEVVRQAAEAAHALHEANVIHRDIKPGNILLTADGGHAVLMDLGLAQLADETEGRLTRTRQFVGTLRYASPEQLVGATLDRRADVYSLGATLWELLTLRPVFGITEQTPTPDMILRLQQAEPEQVRKHNPRVPRDLEAIVLKCLVKEKERRYATAAELAADLDRWQRGEPVQAQPPSLGYLLRKKLRRYRAPVSVAAGVLLAAVVGIVIDFLRINAALALAEQRRKEVETALADKEIAYGELRKAKEDELAGETARSWLRPLAWQRGPLSDQEIEALTVVAAKRNDPLTIRFIEEAAKEPSFTRRLGAHPQYTIHAVVGLDANKRAEVERILVERLGAKETSLDDKTDLSLCLAVLGNVKVQSATQAAATLTQAMTKTNDAVALRYLAVGLSAVATRMEANEADRVSAEAAATLTQAMTKTSDAVALRYLAVGLSAVATRMEANEADRVSAEAAATLTQAISKTSNPGDLEPLVEGLSAVAARLKAKEAAKAAAALNQAITKTNEPNKAIQAIAPPPLFYDPLRYLAQGLSALAARMEAAAAAATLIQAMSETTNVFALQSVAESLSAVAARMEAKEAAAAADKLIQVMSETTNDYSLIALTQGLSAVAARMEAKEAVAAAAGLIQVMSKTTNPNALRFLAHSLSAVAARMEPKEAVRVSAEAAATLIQVMSETTDVRDLSNLAEGLSAVAARMEAKKAARVSAEAAATLIQAMPKTTDVRDLSDLAAGLSAVAPHMEPKEAARVSAEAAATLIQAMSKMTNAASLYNLARGLSTMSARMESKEAARVSAEAAAILIQAMPKTTDVRDILNLTEGLSAVAGRMEAQEAAAAATMLIQAMSIRPNDYYFSSLAKGLSVVVGRMEAKEAARMSAKVAPMFIYAMSKTTDLHVLEPLTQGLSAVAARMEAEEAAAAAAGLIQVMSETTNPNALRFLAHSLSAVAARIEPKEAVRVSAAAAAALTEVMSKTADEHAVWGMAEGLLAVTARLEAKEANRVSAEAAASLMQAMTKEKAVQSLVEGLTANLNRESSWRRQHRVQSAPTLVGLGTSPAVLALSMALAHPALQLPPEPLLTETIIELLKHPLCVGEARRAVLDTLGICYHRQFADQWDFVRFAQEQKLGLDLTSPPKRH